MADETRTANLFAGIVLIIIGLVFLGERYHWFGLHVDLGLDRIWPVFIILGGIYIIIKDRLK